MKRKIKRALTKHEKALTSIAQRRLVKLLKEFDIDYMRVGDQIISTRNKDVERLYNQCMMDVLVDFERLDGKLYLLKQLYGYK